MSVACTEIMRQHTKSKRLGDYKTRLFYFVITCVVLVSSVNLVYAQTQSNSEGQVTLSENLQNDPLAQDILKKIEQTKKMIEDLKQKEFEKNQAQENLEKMRDASVERLNKDLDEWERLWEKQSSKNSFESFVSTKPSYVQGVFLDQFEFKEQKVIAGRNAMNQVLSNGGTVQDARDAYHNAAATQKIEMIEMNSQFNVKHNLANYEEQQIFNSTGQVHLSSATKTKLSEMYADYRLQPGYIMANTDDTNVIKLSQEPSSEKQCSDGYVLVSRVTSEGHFCIEETVAKDWSDRGVTGIVILDDAYNEISSASKVGTNPGTICEDGNKVVYEIATSEYRCVSDAAANEMINANTAEIHTLTEYILNKDKKKTYDDAVYDINQEIQKINEEYQTKKKAIETEYNNDIKHEDDLAEQQMQSIVGEYKSSSGISKEDVTKMISNVRDANDAIKERLLKEKSDGMNRLEAELRSNLSEAVKGYENDPNINVDWSYLYDSPDATPTKNNANDQDTSPDENIGNITMGSVSIVNSFGQKADEIKSNQLMQVSADITNTKDYKQDFTYMVKITDDQNVLVQPAKWVTGTLNPNQTLNAGLSWIPQKSGTFKAAVYAGTSIDSAEQTAEVEINVKQEGDVSDPSYCKEGYELLFKYTDNSPICVTADTAAKMIDTGLAFS